MLGNTLVTPPSVAANTARKPYLNVKVQRGDGNVSKKVSRSNSYSQSKCRICCSWALHVTHVFKSLFFHTFSTSCLMMPVSRIKLWRSKLSPEHKAHIRDLHRAFSHNGDNISVQVLLSLGELVTLLETIFSCGLIHIPDGDVGLT